MGREDCCYNQAMSEAPFISAIVPTLNEESCIEECLERLELAGVEELIVVDGGSADRTRELARKRADKVLVEPGGVFSQMNRGAWEAEGEVFLFQYADGLLSEAACVEIREALETPGIVGGAFRLRLDRPGLFYRAVSFCADWRNRLGFGPFGDQSIFVRAEIFRGEGGFPPAGTLPDHELVRTLGRRGCFRLLREPVLVSARRWERCGKWRTLLRHWRLSALYLAGLRRSRGAIIRGTEGLRKVR
ncbi:MAG: glycosyltransferase [Planctomycetes bacterium]|nr:glycosyltransferase [Planctomycetota bacterium]